MNIQERRHIFIEVTCLWQEKPRSTGKIMLAVAQIQCVSEIPGSDRTAIRLVGWEDDSVQVTESYQEVRALIEEMARVRL